MNRALPALLIALVGCAQRPAGELPKSIAATPGPGVFFVATNGSDQWSGHLPAPNLNLTDGPFATLPRALEAARLVKRQTSPPSSLSPTVCIRGGLHFLDKTLVLKPEDSTLTVSAYADERPRVSGGRRITGWRKTTVAGKTLWAAAAGDGRAPWNFRELWVNGKRAVRARHPNHGYLAVADVPDRSPEWTQGQTRFRFKEGDLNPGPTLTNAEVVVMSRWVESRLPILAIDDKEHMLRFSKRSVFELQKDEPYYVEGALEFLDQPGEWYLDRAGGTLYYSPRPGEQPGTIEAIAPVLTQLIRLEGRPDAGKFVEHVVFRGLTFAHTEWYFPEGFQAGKQAPNVDPAPKAEVGGFAQAAIGVPGAVWADGARHCVFEDCAFSSLGSYGLELGRGCSQNRIARCDFSDLGGGGLKLGETRIRSNPLEQSRANEVTDCHLHDGGKLFHSAIGLWIGQSPDNVITHNHIHDFYYTGISIGWTWGYGPALATNNLVAFNHVHHIGVLSNGDGPILSDMGGIYTLGKQPGTRILNNLWHDIAGLRYGGWGIYFDEGSSGIVAASNVVYRTTHGGLHQHYGETNVVCNNVFAFARDHQIQRTRVEDHISFTFTTNIVYFDTGVLLGGDWGKDLYTVNRNVYFDARPNADPSAMRFAGATLDEWCARGHDLHSIIGDPQFVAPGQDDFRLRAGSPAFKLGFQAIDLSQVGVRLNP